MAGFLVEKRQRNGTFDLCTSPSLQFQTGTRHLEFGHNLFPLEKETLPCENILLKEMTTASL